MSHILLEPEDSDDGGAIPFADAYGGAGIGSRESRLNPSGTEGVCESACEEFGAVFDRRSVVDRDLGLGESMKSGSKGRYTCPCCGEGARRVMRVRVVDQPRWKAMCAVCAASMLARVPGTIVGGMVRPTRKRRPIRLQAAGPVRGEGYIGFRARSGGGYRRAG